MILKRLKIEHKGTMVIDAELFRDNIQGSLNTTLILGENGVGKSFFFKLIIDVFIYLEKALYQKRKPKYEYEKFEIEYILNDNDFIVTRVSSREIKATQNGKEIDYKNIVLPSRLLAVAFMVNDKFVFSENKEGYYKYLGVRSSSNSTYTSSIAKKLTENLMLLIYQGKYKEITDILQMIGFDKKLEFEYKDKNKAVSKVLISDEIEIMVDLTTYLKQIDKVSVCFWKNGKRMTFDNCSSGEKHILFAFVGILNQIKDNSLILIDEPEISLHPEWQIQYISKLTRIFNEYSNCHFILASHSHYFVSDLPSKSSSIVIFRHAKNDLPEVELLPYDTYAWSAENIIYNVFGLRTSRNYYFESDIGKLIKAISCYFGTEEEKINIQKLLSKLEKYSLGNNDPLNELIKEAKDVIECSANN